MSGSLRDNQSLEAIGRRLADYDRRLRTLETLPHGSYHPSQFVGLNIRSASAHLFNVAVLTASGSLEDFLLNDNNSSPVAQGEITLAANTVLAFQSTIPGIGSLSADGDVFGYLGLWRTRDATGNVVSGSGWSAGNWRWSAAEGLGYFDGYDSPTSEYQIASPYVAGGTTYYLGVEVLLAGTYLISGGLFLPYTP